MVSIARQARNLQHARDRETLYIYIATHKSMNDGLTPTREEMASVLGREKGAYVTARLQELQEMGLIALQYNERHVVMVGAEWRLNPIARTEDGEWADATSEIMAGYNIAAYYGAGNE